GTSRLGLLYCVEAPGCARTAALMEHNGLAEQAGATVVFSSPVSLLQPDFTAQCQNMRNAGAQAVLALMDGAAMARLVRSCDAVAFRPPIVADSMAISPAQAGDPLLRRNTVESVNITVPWIATDNPGQRAYQAAMGAYAPNAPLDSSSILGWTSGKLLEAGWARSPADGQPAPTATGIIAGLDGLSGATLGGLTPGLTFRAGHPAPEIGCIYWTR